MIFEIKNKIWNIMQIIATVWYKMFMKFELKCDDIWNSIWMFSLFGVIDDSLPRKCSRLVDGLASYKEDYLLTRAV